VVCNWTGQEGGRKMNGFWMTKMTMGTADNDMAKVLCCWEDESMKELGKS